MPRNFTAYEILIASPGDAESERAVLVEVIEDWNAAHARPTGIMLQARRWELDAVPALGERPQAIINKQLVDEADILIAVFAARLGSPTGVASSGTIEEIERMRSMSKPVFVYFSNSPVPRDHNPDQLRLLNQYKRELSSKGLYFEFGNDEVLRRIVSRHLASTMSALSPAARSTTVPKKPDVAGVSLIIGQKSRSGDVRTVNVVSFLENPSPVRRITEYIATVSVPSACLTFAASTYMGEIRSVVPGRRLFRKTESEAGVILPGDKISLFSLDLGVDQLKMTGTHLAGDIEAALADKVTVEAIVDGERLCAEVPVSEIFAGIS
jgi:hypothetical protein